MDYQIINDCGDLIKKAGVEIFYLQNEDAVIIDDNIYVVSNKHMDYDENIFKLFVELDE